MVKRSDAGAASDGRPSHFRILLFRYGHYPAYACMYCRAVIRALA